MGIELGSVDGIEKSESEISAEVIAELGRRLAEYQQSENDPRGYEHTAMYNLKQALEGREEYRGSDVEDKIIEPKTVAALIEEIDGYIVRDQQELEEVKVSGEEPAPTLVNAIEIQKRKRELLREITGL